MKAPVKPPARWSVATDLTDFERQLLDAAARDRIPGELKARMSAGLEGALGGGGAAVGGGAAASGAPPAAVGGGLLFSKTVAIGLASALLVGGAVGSYVWGDGEHATRGASSPPAAAAAPSGAPAQRLPSAPANGETPAHESMRGSALREEIALIDACRRAVQQRASARAIELLARYDERFPRGTLGPEAAALRIEALMQTGASERARSLAAQFLAANPTSPLAQRVERMAGVGKSGR